MRNVLGIDKAKQTTVQNLCNLAEETPIVKKIIIFGSAASQTCTPESDIDICYDITCDTKDLRTYDLSKKTVRICDYNCDIVFYSLLGSNLKNEIDSKGVIVYES